jgi:AcrR family transcriptional regulator
MTGLRERKKLETRQHIADVAARLFAEHGFEQVTVDQVAAAADVAKKTVFNYFPTKEDLVFDRAEARELAMVSLVRDRPRGTPVLAAFRAQVDRFLDFIAERQPGFQRGSVVELTRSSPTLRRRGLEIRERQATVLAAELAADTGQPEWDPIANTVARTILAAQQSVFFEVHRRLRDGATPREAAESARAVADRLFGLLAAGLADYPVGTGQVE